MGYESRIYIVEKRTKWDDEDKRYASVIAVFDMCCIGDLTRIFESEADCYFYADDGNTQVLEDMYGDPLKETTVKDMIDALEAEIENGNNYRRLFPLLSALKVLNEQQANGVWQNIAVLHYGY